MAKRVQAILARVMPLFSWNPAEILQLMTGSFSTDECLYLI